MRQGSVLSPFLFAVYLDDIWVNRQIIPSYYIIIYADDILLISSSICELQRIFDICESELMWLDMVISVKKSCCMRVGPRNDYTASNIATCDGHKLPWSNEIRYLGTYIGYTVQSRQFVCSLDRAKKIIPSFTQRYLWKSWQEYIWESHAGVN